MAGYIYLSNSNKPSASAPTESKIINLTNMSIPYLKVANELGYSLNMGVSSETIASNTSFSINFFKSYVYRNPFDFSSNIKAYKALCRAIRENEVEAIHCNTPVGGIIGRLAGKKCKVKKIIYQAHGFHFYKGAPKKNWILYYPAEKLLARFTDAIITINKEDFEAAKRFKLKRGGKVYFVHGVGITTADFQNIPADVRKELRNDLGVSDDEILLISVGELNKNKNNAVIIKAISELKNPKIKYALCGVGEEKQALVSLCKELGVENQVSFLGFRNDVANLYKAADIFVMPSFREGLSRSIMEAMASGLPCVVSKIRGNVDLIENGENGYICAAKDAKAFSESIAKLADSTELRSEVSAKNLEKIKSYDVSVVKKEIKAIYSEVLGK